jgi:dephospho-CoA kinase
MRKRLYAKKGQVIGITGNICTGKSFIVNFFKRNGFKTYSLDNFVHQSMLNNQGLKSQISRVFPESIVNNTVSRKILGDIVFNNKAALKKLESIIHPLTKDYLKNIYTNTKNQKCISSIVEIPLLFEKNREEYFDYIIYVASSIKTIYNRYVTSKRASFAKHRSKA